MMLPHLWEVTDGVDHVLGLALLTGARFSFVPSRYHPLKYTI
jgi:hypothetical protein